MGKYMRKTKLTGEIAVMEITHPAPLGVRTRARTLALQRLQRPPTPAPAPDAGSYLQLRNRRLEKPPAAASRPKDGHKSGGATTSRAAAEVKSLKARVAAGGPANSCPPRSAVAAAKSCSRKGAMEKLEAASEASLGSEGVEASFGENVLENEARDRSVRETTPCSLMKGSEITGTPGSTTRARTASNRRAQSARQGGIPTVEEMEGFFAGAEQQQQRMFREKYNFDPVNDCPLPGRYEWFKLDC